MPMPWSLFGMRKVCTWFLIYWCIPKIPGWRIGNKWASLKKTIQGMSSTISWTFWLGTSVSSLKNFFDFDPRIVIRHAAGRVGHAAADDHVSLGPVDL